MFGYRLRELAEKDIDLDVAMPYIRDNDQIVGTGEANNS